MKVINRASYINVRLKAAQGLDWWVSSKIGGAYVLSQTRADADPLRSVDDARKAVELVINRFKSAHPKYSIHDFEMVTVYIREETSDF